VSPELFTGRVQKKPLFLLKLLIALGGRNISASQLEETLWPDAEGDAARLCLKTNVQRLRKLLASGKALAYSNGRLTLCPRYCWVDAWAFERMVTQAEADSGKKAIQLYQGDFLKDEGEQSWAVLRRERLRRLHHMLVQDTGTAFESQQAWQQATEVYRRGLNINELAEGFYQGLMRCHRQLGEKAEAILVYRQCKKALAIGLGIKPSSITSALYQAIAGDNGRDHEQ
jgi:two-component SAPR family response regulator